MRDWLVRFGINYLGARLRFYRIPRPALRMVDQAREASQQIQRLQTSLEETRQRRATIEQTLRDRDTAIVGFQERTAGLERQLAEREVHIASIESKHLQARDALEHFRLASKEQRELEARQHEQAVQALQAELRRASESAATKNDELLTLNRDNARLTEQAGQHNKELREGRSALQAAKERTAEADALRKQNQSLEQHLIHTTTHLEAMCHEQSAACSHWDTERITLEEALRDARAQNGRWSAIESMLTSLQARPGAAHDTAAST